MDLNQGKNCKWVLSGKDGNLSFTTDIALDSYLEKNIGEFNGEGLPFFSMDLQESAIKTLADIKIDFEKDAVEYIRSMEDPTEEEKILAIPGSIGANRFLSNYGSKRYGFTEPILPPFEPVNWESNFENQRIAEAEQKFVENFVKNGKGSETDAKNEFVRSGARDLASDLAKQAIKQQEDELWPELTKHGTEFHEIVENTINGKDSVPKHFSVEQVKQIQEWTKNLIENFKKTYGKNCKFYTEFAFKTDDLKEDARIKLEAVGQKPIITGIADLLIVDDFGNVHVFDFKVSRKGVGNWNEMTDSLIPKRNYSDNSKDNVFEGEWSSAKKYAIKNQLAMYVAMLRQKGLTVKDAGVIPVKLDFAYKSEFEIDHLKKINLPSESEIIHNISGAASGSEYEHIVGTIINVPNISFNEDMEKVFDKLKQVIPGASVTSSVARKVHEDLEYYKKNLVGKVDPSDSEHYGKYKYKFYKNGTSDRKPIYANDDDIDTKLQSYINELVSVRATEVSDLGHRIKTCMGSVEKNLDDILGSVPTMHQDTYKDQIKKYIDQGWELSSDDTQISAGFFIFTRGAETEIVMITNLALFNIEVSLPFGKTLLGKTTRDKDAKLKQILEASNGNIEILKALIFISENQEWFSKKKITQIRAINPWRGQVLETVLNEQALNNYEQLRLHNPGILKPLDTDIFSRDVQALYKLAKAKMEGIDSTIIDFDETKYDMTQVESTKEWVANQMKALKSKYRKLANDATYSPHDEVWQTYNFLGQILMRLNGISTKSELDKGRWLQSGASPTGLFIASPQQSASINIQDFAKIHDRYVAEVRQMQQKLGWEMQKALSELYKSTKNGAGVFDPCFRRDPDGKISSDFALKNPNDPEFDGQPQLRKVLNLFLETMFKLRNPHATDHDLEVAKTTLDYYKVPLTEAVFSRQAKNLGVWTAIKNKVKQYKELTEGIFAGDLEMKEEYERENDQLYNKFNLADSERDKKIRDHGVGFFETHLEIVFNQALIAYTKQQVSSKYVPIFKAMQLGLRHEDLYGHAGTEKKKKLEGIQEAMDKFIQNRFYGKPIMDGYQKTLYSWLQVVSQFFSTIRLGLNVRSFCREMLNGIYIQTTRVMTKQIEGVSMENYTNALTYIMQDLPNNFSGISMLQQLNATYGMANYSLGSITNQRRLNWLNIKNWGRDTLFVGCSAPDYNHRMAILMAKMMGDGCWEAHSLNDDGELVYYFKKDKRFEAYTKGDTSDPKYIEQKTLYLKNLEEWNAQGYTKPDGTYLKEGDDLPHAYTNREGQSIKNYADLLYGHYDDESRGLLNDMFLGSFFMQFKTFMTAKMEQWFMKEGLVNMEHLKQQYDPITKEKLYEIIVYPNNDLSNMPSREIIKESDLKSRTEEEQKAARPYIEWTGQPMEGMIYSMWTFAKAIKNMDQEKLKELWNNPHDRGLLLIGLSDMFICALFGVLIRALFGAAVGSEEWKDINKDVRNSGYLQSFSYSVLTGFANDGPPTAIVKSMLSDMNPPLITNLHQFVDSCTNVITGSQSITYALTRNIGLLSDLSGVVKKMEENK